MFSYSSVQFEAGLYKVIKQSILFWGPGGASRQRKVREGQNYTEACQLLIFSTGLIYVTLVGTEAATFGLPDQRATAPH